MGGSAKAPTNEQQPWREAAPYLVGNGAKSITGVYPEAAKLYDNSGFTPEMQGALDMYLGQAGSRMNDPNIAYAQKGAGDVMRGEYDSLFGPVAGVNTPQTNLVDARSGQGRLDPTGALLRTLTGRPDNPYLDKQASAITANLTRNLNENVMPGLRSEALLSGQYGGSRQGIAEGLAASRLNQDLAPALTGLYGGAYENAQNRMAGTANALNEQAFMNAQNNAGLNMQGQQFNSNLGLQNNAQLMQRNTQNLDNRMQGLNILGNVGGLQDNNFDTLMSGLQMPYNYNMNRLQNYNSFVQPGLTAGGTQQASVSKNRVVGGLGGAASGAMAGAMMGSIVPGIGTAVGALGGAIMGGAAGSM